MTTMFENKRWANENPSLDTGPISTEPCISQEYFELERDRVFRRTWINVGRVDDIPNVGDYFVQDLVVCQTSILLMRGTDNVVRGFHNVCSHRQNLLVTENKKGSCRGMLKCGFHAWTYNTKGELRSVPDEDNFFDFKRSELGLTPVTTDTWEGFIFINLDPNPQESLIQYLGGVVDQLKGSSFNNCTLAHTFKVEENANWKVVLDAQNESYHVPFQHRYSIPNMFTFKDHQCMRHSDLKLFNHHSVWASKYDGNNSEIDLSPVNKLMMQLDTGITKCRLPMLGDTDFYQVFPNFVIMTFRGVTNDYYATYNIWPLTVDRCIWEIKIYFVPAENVGQRLSQEYNTHRISDVLQEDAAAHECLQVGLTSRAKSNLILQDDEIQIRHFYKVLEDYMCFFNKEGSNV